MFIIEKKQVKHLKTRIKKQGDFFYSHRKRWIDNFNVWRESLSMFNLSQRVEIFFRYESYLTFILGKSLEELTVNQERGRNGIHRVKVPNMEDSVTPGWPVTSRSQEGGWMQTPEPVANGRRGGVLQEGCFQAEK